LFKNKDELVDFTDGGARYVARKVKDKQNASAGTLVQCVVVLY
jgi:hypothetical protein